MTLVGVTTALVSQLDVHRVLNSIFVWIYHATGAGGLYPERRPEIAYIKFCRV